jgi:chemotaxis protein methyltransferase CheR
MLYARAGISISARKRDMVYSRLARRLRHHRIDRFSTYLDSLDALDEVQAFVNALTTNLTAFFREEHHFSILRDYITERGKPAGLRVWSAAASTGEEAYSIAITLAEAYGSMKPPVQILASDVDTEVLATGISGIYKLARLDDLPQPIVSKYFKRGTGSNAGFARVDPTLRDLITFEQINLLDLAPIAEEPFDVIFCRNVLIYFDRIGQRRVLERLHPRLKDGGLLMLGHSETLRDSADLFASLGRTAYRKASTLVRASA